MVLAEATGAPEPLALDLWDDQTWHEIATRSVRICREAGALAILPNALTYRACLHVLAGEFTAASALIDEAYAIAEATGSAPLRYPSLLLAAWRGQEAEAVSVIDACVQDAKARGLERPIGFAQCVTALLFNGLGRYHDALAAAQRARAYFPADHLDDLGQLGWALIELVEAGVLDGEAVRALYEELVRLFATRQDRYKVLAYRLWTLFAGECAWRTLFGRRARTLMTDSGREGFSGRETPRAACG